MLDLLQEGDLKAQKCPYVLKDELLGKMTNLANMELSQGSRGKIEFMALGKVRQLRKNTRMSLGYVGRKLERPKVS